LGIWLLWGYILAPCMREKYIYYGMLRRILGQAGNGNANANAKIVFSDEDDNDNDNGDDNGDGNNNIKLFGSRNIDLAGMTGRVFSIIAFTRGTTKSNRGGEILGEIPVTTHFGQTTNNIYNRTFTSWYVLN
jgi:hypothetical protein